MIIVLFLSVSLTPLPIASPKLPSESENAALALNVLNLPSFGNCKVSPSNLPIIVILYKSLLNNLWDKKLLKKRV